MADYSGSKPVKGVYPDRAVDAQEWSRVEPLLTPTQLRSRQLLAISLVSFMPDPITGKRYEITNDDLADQINRAAAALELELGMSIFPVQFQEKHPFDRQFWDSYGYIKVDHRPVASVELFAFTPPTGTDIFAINLDWVETANLHKGQLNIIPIVPAISANYVSGTVASGNSGFAYLQLVSGLSWMPAIVNIKYTAGFPNAMVPRIINELIGINAALEVLSALQMTSQGTSYSISIDGASQSFSGPGPQAYQGRIDYLLQQKAVLIKKVKNIYGLSMVSSYV
jgi:hypothetical protein